MWVWIFRAALSPSTETAALCSAHCNDLGKLGGCAPVWVWIFKASLSPSTETAALCSALCNDLSANTPAHRQPTNPPPSNYPINHQTTHPTPTGTNRQPLLLEQGTLMSTGS